MIIKLSIQLLDLTNIITSRRYSISYASHSTLRVSCHTLIKKYLLNVTQYIWSSYYRNNMYLFYEETGFLKD